MPSAVELGGLLDDLPLPGVMMSEAGTRTGQIVLLDFGDAITFPTTVRLAAYADIASLIHTVPGTGTL